MMTKTSKLDIATRLRRSLATVNTVESVIRPIEEIKRAHGQQFGALIAAIARPHKDLAYPVEDKMLCQSHVLIMSEEDARRIIKELEECL